MNWTCSVFLAILAGFSRAIANLFFNDNRQTCLRDGMTLKVSVLCTKFCSLCDKQVIASALGQLKINFTCIFKFFQIALVASRPKGNFVKTLKILVKLILNCPRAHAITYTNLLSLPCRLIGSFVAQKLLLHLNLVHQLYSFAKEHTLPPEWS